MTYRDEVIDQCIKVVAEQRCQRGTPWDLALTTAMGKLQDLKLLDPIQKDCKYGFVLPDRCRYMRHLGCDCGAYPPIKDPV